MPRKTRAAARAQQAAEEIHEDEHEASMMGDDQDRSENTVQLAIGEKANAEGEGEKPAKIEEKKTTGKKKRNNRKRNRKSKENNQINLVTVPAVLPEAHITSSTSEAQPESAQTSVQPPDPLSSPTRRTRAAAKQEESLNRWTEDPIEPSESTTSVNTELEGSASDATRNTAMPVQSPKKEASALTTHESVRPVTISRDEPSNPDTAMPQSEVPIQAPVSTPSVPSHKLDSLFEQPLVQQQDAPEEEPFAAIIARSPSKSPKKLHCKSASKLRAPSKSPSKSPSKAPPAKEDPFDVMDALEDAEDAVRELSRTRATTLCDDVPAATSKTESMSRTIEPAVQTAASPVKSPAKAKASTATVSSERKARPTATKPIGNRPSSFMAPKKSPTKPISQGESKPIKSNITALHTPQKPTRSTKAPTVPTFSLAGDAVHEKLRAAREERQKRREEEEVQRKQQTVKTATLSKPKPAPSQATLPLRSRPSLASGADTLKTRTMTDKATPAAVAGTVSASRPAKPARPVSAIMSRATGPTISKSRPSSMVLSKASESSLNARSGLGDAAQAGVKANTARARAPVAAAVKSNSSKMVKPRSDTAKINTGGIIPAPSSTSAAPTDLQRIEAAKKARAEAAERGRLASQKWAAQMKEKSASAGVVTDKVD